MTVKPKQEVAKVPKGELAKQAEMFDISQITKETVRKYICEKANDQEILMFIATCKAQDLNPLPTAREAYLVKYKDDTPAQILTGYEVYLKKAEASQKYGGMKLWTEGDVHSDDLKGCVEIYRKDWTKPLYHEVDFEEYAQYMYDYKTKQRRLTKFWSGKPKTMIKKVAASQGLRFAFPKEMDRLPYIQEEAQQHLVELEPQEQLDMPKETEPDTQPSDVAQPLEDATGATQPPESGSTTTPPVSKGEISKEGIQEIAKLALKNGYVKEDFIEYIKELGYTSPKEILIQDLPTIVNYFGKPKAERTVPPEMEEDTKDDFETAWERGEKNGEL